ncbi:hypothetical protein P7K49_015022 [Saguinus oedipus]|uniref:Uncharacterized protein n=1 Tax=Saguinus oedipus TaxID=9490 RepID=A0ABQ9V818_SAGOE|nr:hypothetical protein P7K49_015022 [Saguinus oedipus]
MELTVMPNFRFGPPFCAPTSCSADTHIPTGSGTEAEDWAQDLLCSQAREQDGPNSPKAQKKELVSSLTNLRWSRGVRKGRRQLQGRQVPRLGGLRAAPAGLGLRILLRAVTRQALTKYVPFPSLARPAARRRPEPRGCRLDVVLPGCRGPAPQGVPPAQCPSGKVGVRVTRPTPTARAGTCTAACGCRSLGSPPGAEALSARAVAVPAGAKRDARRLVPSAPRCAPAPRVPPDPHCLLRPRGYPAVPRVSSAAPHCPSRSALSPPVQWVPAGDYTAATTCPNRGRHLRRIPASRCAPATSRG